MIEIELKLTRSKSLRIVHLEELPSKGDEIHFDTYPNNGPRVEEIYEINFFYRIFKPAENTRYIALVNKL